MAPQKTESEPTDYGLNSPYFGYTPEPGEADRNAAREARINGGTNPLHLLLATTMLVLSCVGYCTQNKPNPATHKQEQATGNLASTAPNSSH